MPQNGTLNWQKAEPSIRELCEEALKKIQMRIRSRRLYMHPFFRSYDKYALRKKKCLKLTQKVQISLHEVHMYP